MKPKSRIARVIEFLDRQGLDGEQPFALAASALRSKKDDWTAAYSMLRAQANRFALGGDQETAELVGLAARIVRFYGRGF